MDVVNRTLASRPFLFVVGPEKKEFHIHKELVAGLSPALNVMVNGKMREASELRVEWPDVDVDTFLRFAKFAYSGTYTEADPEDLETTQERSPPETIDLTDERDAESADVISEEENQSDLDDDLDDDDDDDDDDDEGDEEGISEDESQDSLDAGMEPLPFTQMDLKRLMRAIPDRLPYSLDNFNTASAVVLDNHGVVGCKRRRLPWDGDGFINPDITIRTRLKIMFLMYFKAIGNSVRAKNSRVPQASLEWAPLPNSNPDRSYEPVFLSHARLYFLADMYDIENLREVSMYRLYRTLYVFQVYAERIPDLVRLAEEIYNNTVENDPARQLITSYLSCFAEHIRPCEELQHLLKSNGDFAHDMFNQMAHRLSIVDDSWA